MSLAAFGLFARMRTSANSGPMVWSEAIIAEFISFDNLVSTVLCHSVKGWASTKRVIPSAFDTGVLIWDQGFSMPVLVPIFVCAMSGVVYVWFRSLVARVGRRTSFFHLLNRYDRFLALGSYKREQVLECGLPVCLPNHSRFCDPRVA